MTDKLFTKRLRELTDDAIRESLAEISVEFEKRFGRAALTASPPVVEREALENAAKNLLAGMSGTYKSRNGREMGIEADDGEKCWIVHSDLIAALEGALADASVVEEGRREAVKDARERVCKLTMQDGAVIEAEYPNGGDWAKSWSIRYPPDMKCGTTGEQDWELVEKYGLTEILDAVILALTPVEGVGERLRPFVQHKVNCRMQLRMGNRECSCGLTDALAALSTPVAQGDEVRDALERIDKFVTDYLSPWGSWKTPWWEGEVSDDIEFTDVNALKHVAGLVRATLTKGARDAG